MPDAGLADAPPLDVLHVPGGFGQEALMEDAEVLGWIRQQAAGACSIFSVCTGALLCGAAGLLKGRRAFTHWASLHLLPFFGAIPVNERVVVDGSFVFAAGGVGIEVTKSVGLEPVGYNPKQQMAGEMFRGRLAKCVPPPATASDRDSARERSHLRLKRRRTTVEGRLGLNRHARFS